MFGYLDGAHGGYQAVENLVAFQDANFSGQPGAVTSGDLEAETVHYTVG